MYSAALNCPQFDEPRVSTMAASGGISLQGSMVFASRSSFGLLNAGAGAKARELPSDTLKTAGVGCSTENKVGSYSASRSESFRDGEARLRSL